MQKLRVGFVRAVVILTLAAIGGCGADGEPVPPTKNVVVGGSLTVAPMSKAM